MESVRPDQELDLAQVKPDIDPEVGLIRPSQGTVRRDLGTELGPVGDPRSTSSSYSQNWSRLLGNRKSGPRSGTADPAQNKKMKIKMRLDINDFNDKQ